MGSTVKSYGNAPGGLKFEENVWTCIAAEHEDENGETVIDHAEIGTRRRERYGQFAFKAEAEAWIAEQVAEGFVLDSGPTPLATFYHGPTDSSSNAWSARVSKSEGEVVADGAA